MPPKVVNIPSSVLIVEDDRSRAVKFLSTEGFPSWQFLKVKKKIKSKKIDFNFPDNANKTHTSLLRWPFAATLHAKRQSLDWYPHNHEKYFHWGNNQGACGNTRFTHGYRAFTSDADALRCEAAQLAEFARRVRDNRATIPWSRRVLFSFLSKIDDSEVKNKWRWTWAAEKDRLRPPVKSCIRKCERPCHAYCAVCSHTIIYGGNGKKSHP